MKRTVYEVNFDKLAKVVDIDALRTTNVYSGKSKVQGYMDFNLDVLERAADGTLVIAISHYGVQNGDSMADPDMTLRVYPHNMVEALTYQNDYVHVYQEVYPAPGKYYPKLKTQLNRFLGTWLTNLINQKHKITKEDME